MEPEVVTAAEAAGITPAMLAAGIEALKLASSLDGSMDPYPEIVIDIFTAMKRAEAEIEITPEMVEAGHNEMVSFNHDFEGPEEAAVRVFLAMWRARPDSFPAG